MDKQTLSNYGWVIITVLVLAVMIALATPFGTYVKEGAKSTLTGLFESSENALNTGLLEMGISVNKAEFGNTSMQKCCGSPNIVVYDDDAKCLNCSSITYGTKKHNGIIPEGAILEVFDTTWDENYIINTTGEVLQQGDAFPETIKSGTVYKCGDYLFILNGGNALTSPLYLDGTIGRYFNIITGDAMQNNNHWGVICIYPGKTTCEDIPAFVCDLPVTDLTGCFADSAYGGGFALTKAPRIPETANSVSFIFAGCDNLEEAILPCHCYSDGTEYGPSGTKIPGNAIIGFYHTNYYGCDGSCGFSDNRDAIELNIHPNENINKYGKNDATLNHSGTIPEGAAYVQNTTLYNSWDAFPWESVNQIGPSIYADFTNSTTYATGNAFPTIKTNDMYYFGGNEYIYNFRSNQWEVNAVSNGIILESINGKPVVDMWNTYYSGDVESIIVPKTVEKISTTCLIDTVKYEFTFAGTKEEFGNVLMPFTENVKVVHFIDGYMLLNGYILKGNN